MPTVNHDSDMIARPRLSQHALSTNRSVAAVVPHGRTGGDHPMRAHVLFTVLATTALGLAMSAAAQLKYPSVLEGHAILPAMTLVPAPADAPPDLQISGRFAGPPGQRIDTPESMPGISALSDKAAPRP